eukprot:IDg7499t1
MLKSLCVNCNDVKYNSMLVSIFVIQRDSQELLYYNNSITLSEFLDPQCLVVPLSLLNPQEIMEFALDGLFSTIRSDSHALHSARVDFERTCKYYNLNANALHAASDQFNEIMAEIGDRRGQLERSAPKNLDF